jgi:transcriptional regulator with XRE-family HTH domain
MRPPLSLGVEAPYRNGRADPWVMSVSRTWIVESSRQTVRLSRVSDADMYTADVELPKDFDKIVGSNVRHVRRANGVTQEYLAGSLGLARTSVTNIEAGRQSLSAWTLWCVANALGAQVGDFLPDASEHPEPPLRSLPDDLTPKSRDLINRLVANR